MSEDIATTIYYQKLKTILDGDEAAEVINDLIKLHQLKNSEKNQNNLVLVDIYELLGLELFAKLIELTDGKTIKFPSREEFKDTIQLAVSYYFKEIENMSWKEIKDILKDPDLPTVKYGIRMQKLKIFLQYMAERIGAGTHE